MSRRTPADPAPGADALPDPLPVEPPAKPPERVVVRPPGSKSLTNRALLLAALAHGESSLTGAEIDTDDGAAMLGAIEALGARVDRVRDGSLTIGGVASKPDGGGRVDARDSGTTARFIAAAAALANEPVAIDGSQRLRERPMAPLFQALRGAGASVECAAEPDRLPARVSANGQALQGGEIEIAGGVSSQFVSALLMIGAHCEQGLSLRLTSPPVSEPYIAMTLALLQRTSVAVHAIDPMRAWSIPPQAPRAFDLEIEPDASAAMIFAAAALLLPGVAIELDGLGGASLQGDARFLDILAQMGAQIERQRDRTIVRAGGDRIHPVDVDLSPTPDQAMTLAALACFADGATTIYGLRTLRDKECDRLAALAAELPKLGVDVDIFAYGGIAGSDEGLRITPPARDRATGDRIVFDTYNDHRMAMALALTGLRREGVAIRNPPCVRKTYPAFWRDFSRLGAANLS